MAELTVAWHPNQFNPSLFSMPFLLLQSLLNFQSQSQIQYLIHYYSLPAANSLRHSHRLPGYIICSILNFKMLYIEIDWMLMTIRNECSNPFGLFLITNSSRAALRRFRRGRFLYCVYVLMRRMRMMAEVNQRK